MRIKKNSKLLFVGGDISGIQKFIYSISSKKAMVSLKGRSEYLSEFLSNLCKGILELKEVASLDYKEIIYCSGGKFYIIMDDAPEVRAAIDGFYIQQEEYVWKTHLGQLGLAIAYVPFSLNDEGRIMIGDESYPKIGVLWEMISSEFVRLKNQKFKKLLTGQYSDFFDVIPVGGEVKVCAITGIESADCVNINTGDGEENMWVLPSVREQIRRGMKLRDQEHFKNLEEYADGSFLGILRMDVDGLGSRFIKGFDSFDSYKEFSDRLTCFFDVKLAELQEKFSDYLNIVYAGGDDLFAVGRWDKIIDFAEAVRTSFASHMEGEPVTISGGVAVVGAKFPIAKASEMAGEAEERAKQFRDGQKNSISFLGETVSWNGEFDKVKKTKEEFIKQISVNGVSKGVLHQLILYSGNAIEGDSLNYKWHEVYYLTRMMERSKKGSEAHLFLSNLRKDGLSRSKDEYRLLRLSARWAELCMKEFDTN